MKISLFSNYLNIHQLPIAEALSSRHGVDFRFVSYMRSAGDVGRDNLDADYDYVIPAYEGGLALEAALDRARHDDVVIMAPMDGFEPFRDARDEVGGITFLYSERLLKRGQWWRFVPFKGMRVYNQFFNFRNIEPWILCSSAFTSADLSKFGFPPCRCLKWGYFPQLANLHPKLKKLPENITFCSAQRLVHWKRVDLQIQVLQRLLRLGFEPFLYIAGDGSEAPKLRMLAQKLGVSSRIGFLGQISHNETLALMAASDIFLATSDRKEGWGATVNEAMAMGCVVVGSSLMGSIPFLLLDGVNGLVFESGSLDSLTSAVSKVLEQPSLIPYFSSSAIERVSTTWSASCAALRLIESCELLLSGGCPPIYEDGPLSAAYVLEDDWLKERLGVAQ